MWHAGPQGTAGPHAPRLAPSSRPHTVRVRRGPPCRRSCGGAAGTVCAALLAYASTVLDLTGFGVRSSCRLVDVCCDAGSSPRVSTARRVSCRGSSRAVLSSS